MFSCLQILEAFLWFVLITLLNVTLIILTLSVSRLLNLLLRLVAFLLFLNPQCLASISRWITASRDRKSGSAGMPRPISYAVFCLKKKKKRMTKDGLILTDPLPNRTTKFPMIIAILHRNESRSSAVSRMQ